MSAKLVGLARIGRDAELRFTPQNDAVINLSLAFNYGKKVDGKFPTQWVDASLWGKRAEAMAQYLVKGQLVCVTLSDVHIETFEGKNGAGSKLVARVDDIEFAGSAPQQQSQGDGYAPQQQRSAPPQQQRQAPARQPVRQAAGGGGSSGFDDMDDDIPFITASYMADEVTSIDRRKRAYDCRQVRK